MTPAELALAGLVLVVAVGAGIVAHELSHALALRAFRVPYDLEWLPDQDERSVFTASISGRLAAVTPRTLPQGLPPWRLRFAALTPLVLALPFVLVPVGVLPDPIQTGNVYVFAATVGWLACALPSPQDFSLVWYAERVIADHVSGADERDA